MEYMKDLIQTYQAQLAGQYPGDENETLDKIEEVCNALNMSVEDAFDQFDYQEIKMARRPAKVKIKAPTRVRKSALQDPSWAGYENEFFSVQ